jgi:hypothetical protein
VPRVSVIVPLFNKAPTIARALESVGRQTFSDLELIVVDDGSTDEGSDVVRALGGEKLELIQQENSGPGAARNRGASRARGEILAFLDADDTWDASYLEKAVSTLDENPDISWAVAGYFDSLTGKSSEALWQGRGLKPGGIRLTEDTPAPLVLNLLRFILTPSTTIRRSVFQEVGGFYEGSSALFGEDTFLWLKLLFSDHSLHIDLEPRFTFHREDSGLSRNLSGARPIEPFLMDPDPLLAACPHHLEALLLAVLRSRAYKTACMLGFWGEWRSARAVRKQYPALEGWRSPLLLPAVVAGTPLGSLVGSLWRRVAGVPAAKAS